MDPKQPRHISVKHNVVGSKAKAMAKRVLQDDSRPLQPLKRPRSTFSSAP